ncbi:MAG TPA: tetratricopeptide repeat protein [Candidatus Acidoferrales bacterium]|nr:tetratricopeptide repeat protein [Candidatus Acidoferrales bacterium]
MLRPGWLIFSLTLAAAAVAAPVVWAQETPPQLRAQVRPVTAAAISLQSERKLREAFEHVYSLEFGPARQLLKEVAAAEPESATVCAFWASALLYEIMAHQGSLQSQLFVTSNEFLRHARLAVDPALDASFHSVSALAEQRARHRLEKNPDDVDGLFGLGLVYASQANYLAGVKAEYVNGVRKGEKAYDLHNRLRELRPEIHDTGVVLGVREYVIGSLPRATRFLLFFLGAGGNAERGLDYLRETAERGEFLRTYARVLLTVAWIRAEKLDRALVLLKGLQAHYPRNPIFLLELAKLYHQLERYPEAARTCRTLLAEVTAHPHNPRIIGPEDALLELALVEAAQGQTEQALETLGQVEEIPDANKRVASQALLERGKMLDQQGRRPQAVAAYQKVLNLAADLDSIRQARAYRQQAYRPEDRE